MNKNIAIGIIFIVIVMVSGIFWYLNIANPVTAPSKSLPGTIIKPTTQGGGS